MAKNLVDLVKNLSHINKSRTFRGSLTEEQRQEYEKVLEFIISLPKLDRPSYKDIRILLLKEFGKAPTNSTWRRDLERVEHVSA